MLCERRRLVHPVTGGIAGGSIRSKLVRILDERLVSTLPHAHLKEEIL